LGNQYGHTRLRRPRCGPRRYISVRATFGGAIRDWLAESSKNLTTIYVTHAHGDHFFGLKLLLDRFQNAQAFATASNVAAMQEQIKPDFIKSFWEPHFPGQVPSLLVVPQVLEGNTLYLEGEELNVSKIKSTAPV